MKTWIGFAVVVCVMTTAVPCYAGEYVDQMEHKLTRGVINAVSSIGEIGKGVSEEMNGDEGPFYGAIVGVFKGSGKAIVRAASGIYDIVVSPIPHIKTFPPVPETLFEEPVTQ